MKKRLGLTTAATALALAILVVFVLAAVETGVQATRASDAQGASEVTAVDDPTARVALSNQAPAPDTDSGSLDAEATLAVVREFAARQESVITGKAGWLRLRSSISIPMALKGNGYHVAGGDAILPMTELTPQDAVFESWYRLSETGDILEGMGLVLSQDGAIHQQTILSDGKWINLTLKEAGAYRQQYETAAGESLRPLLANSLVLETLEERQNWKGVAIRSSSENGRFELVIEQTLETPIDDAVGISEPVTATRELFSFDEATGDLVSRVAQYMTGGGSWQTGETELYSRPEPVDELPEEIQQLIGEAAQVLK